MRRIEEIQKRIDKGASTIGEAVNVSKLKDSLLNKKDILQNDKTVTK